MIQGWVVVLQNRDGRILAETGGRQVFKGRSASYSDYNRVTEALRQPGSAIQEGLRGVVRLPTGTAHALASHGFPIAVKDRNDE